MSLAALVTGLGHGLVSWGLGGGDATSTAVPGCIVLRERSRRLHPGDVAIIDIEIRTYADDLTDPAAVVATVLMPTGSTIAIAYGAPNGNDSIVRRGVGLYTLYVDLTTERGPGIFKYSVVATGFIQAAEPGSFIVNTLPV